MVVYKHSEKENTLNVSLVFKDTHMEKAPSNKTPALKSS